MGLLETVETKLAVKGSITGLVRFLVICYTKKDQRRAVKNSGNADYYVIKRDAVFVVETLQCYRVLALGGLMIVV